jgi:hypothetical protein
MNEAQDNTPWSDELVEALKWHQSGVMFHPYTCGNCRNKLGIWFLKQDDGTLIPEPPGYDRSGDGWKKIVCLDRELVPTKDGFVCPTCDYKQTHVMENTVETVKAMKEIADTHPFYKCINA